MLKPLPLLKQAWSLRKDKINARESAIFANIFLRQLDMIKRDSRIMSRVETRRGFIPVEDCEF